MGILFGRIYFYWEFCNPNPDHLKRTPLTNQPPTRLT